MSDDPPRQQAMLARHRQQQQDAEDASEQQAKSRSFMPLSYSEGFSQWVCFSVASLYSIFD